MQPGSRHGGCRNLLGSPGNSATQGERAPIQRELAPWFVESMIKDTTDCATKKIATSAERGQQRAERIASAIYCTAPPAG